MIDIMIETSHPADTIGATDPFLVDLQPYHDAAQAKRDAANLRHAAIRARELRELYDEQTRPAAQAQQQTPAEIMARSPAELFLCSMDRVI